MLIPTSSFNSPIWPVQKIYPKECYQRIIIKLKQVVIPIKVGFSDVVSFLEPINIFFSI